MKTTTYFLRKVSDGAFELVEQVIVDGADVYETIRAAGNLSDMQQKLEEAIRQLCRSKPSLGADR